ncbi:hypothetical protein SRABI80_00389 [Peribacillus frigoritolerans]|nr:hypothetical protein SRABI80_00389 [Peribacillus frigoritolerans]
MIKNPFEDSQTDQTRDAMNHVAADFLFIRLDVKDLPQKISC